MPEPVPRWHGTCISLAQKPVRTSACPTTAGVESSYLKASGNHGNHAKKESAESLHRLRALRWRRGCRRKVRLPSEKADVSGASRPRPTLELLSCWTRNFSRGPRPPLGSQLRRVDCVLLGNSVARSCCCSHGPGGIRRVRSTCNQRCGREAHLARPPASGASRRTTIDGHQRS